MTAATPPVLPADLTAGLRRLKLAAMRQLAPELLRTAKTQRWAPEEVLRALVEAEITARDASNQRTRLKAAGFPVLKTLEEFDLTVSSIPAPTFAYLWTPTDSVDSPLNDMMIVTERDRSWDRHVRSTRSTRSSIRTRPCSWSWNLVVQLPRLHATWV